MRILVYLVLGGAVGTLSGVLGIGGGVLLVPLLMWLCGFDFRTAAGTTLAFMTPPVTLPAAVRRFQDGDVDLQAAVCLAVAFALGGYLGAGLVRHLAPDTLRFCFGLILIVVALRFLVSTDAHAAAAASGLIAAAAAWVTFLGLRALGRHHLRPQLGEHVRRQAARGTGAGDYQI